MNYSQIKTKALWQKRVGKLKCMTFAHIKVFFCTADSDLYNICKYLLHPPLHKLIPFNEEI